MNTAQYLWEFATKRTGKALPLLSFPCVQKMGVTVRALVEDSKKQAEAMRIVAQETPTLAAVCPMDLSVEAQVFGAQARWSEDEVPTITGRLIRDAKDAQTLQVPQVGQGRTGLCLETVQLAKKAITHKPVLAGMIGPYSLAGRLLDVTEIMYLCYDEPRLVHSVLRKATQFLVQYAASLRDAGADGLVLAEPLAGLLSPQLNGEFSTPYVKHIVEAVQTTQFAVIYHNCGNAVEQLLGDIFSVGAAAYHFGNAVRMENVLSCAPKTALCMGNIDPAGQFANGTAQSVAQATQALLSQCGQRDNFILSSGCDIPPRAKWENIRAFFDAAQEYEHR